MKILLLVCLGGAVGAGLRHLTNVYVTRLIGAELPWATLSVNVVGSLLMGLFIEALMLRLNGSPELRALIATGLLGGLTTFSTFSLEIMTMLERGAVMTAGIYISVSVAASVLALALGMMIARAVLA